MFGSTFTKLNLGKIALVLFLTVLIWVWADLALDETPPARVAVVKVEELGSEAIWASFSRQSSVEVKVTLSGPHSAFVALDGQLRSENKKLTFVFDPEAERMTEPPGRPLNLLDFLQKAKSLKDLGLKVESCVPESVQVDVIALVKKQLPVECFKEDGQSIKTQSIEPSTVDMFAPEAVRSAQVRLSAVEIEQAKLAAVEKTPYIVLAEGRTRSASDPVKIKIPTEQSLLADYSISPATLSIALSPALHEKYAAEVTNLTQALGPIAVRASAEAKRAYEMQALPHMTLYIYDDDAKKAEAEQSRAVVYNFPEQFVRKGEIELKNPSQPVEAKFRLIRLASPEAGRAVEE